MKFSVWPLNNTPPAEVLDTARWADANGFHGIWYADHYMPNTGSEEIRRGDAHECWAMLPAIAMVTERIRIGSLVSPTSVHHPAVLANRAVTVDHLSGGRLVLGVGAGWQINEHHAYGIELEPPRRRVDRFEEAIRVIRSLLTEERTTFHGSIYTITDAPADPKPIQSPLPILVGTGGDRMMRITARFADEWNTWGTVESATARRRAFVEACEAVGVDPAGKWTSVQAVVFLTDTEAQAEEVLAGDWGPRAIAGPVSKLVDELGQYAASGFDEFIVPDFNLGRTLDARLEALDRLRSEVFSQL